MKRRTIAPASDTTVETPPAPPAPPDPPTPSTPPPSSPAPSPVRRAGAPVDDPPARPATERGVIALIREIQAGSLSGRNLPPEDRRRCVEHLVSEGYSTVETAEILGVAERTIARDRAAIREANAVEADPTLAPQVVGQLFRHAELAAGRLRRLSRERECPPAVRVDAERVNWLILSDLVRTLQRLGWLPSAAQQVRGDITHRFDDLPAVDELESLLVEAARVEGIARAAGVEGDVTVHLGQIRDVAARHALAARIADVESATHTTQENDDDHD